MKSSREYRFNLLYGISEEDYERMYEEQEGNCYICKTHMDLLVVDHDHQTQKVRYLLCNSCNTGLGMFDAILNF